MDTTTKTRRQQIELVYRLRTKWNTTHPDDQVSTEQVHEVISDMRCMISGVRLDCSVPMLTPVLRANGDDIDVIASGAEYLDSLSELQLKQIKVLVLRAEKKFKV